MLQQTQVEAVIPYFERFLAAFPSLAALAGASEAEVLRHWSGLGYYRRARMLHQAAGMVRETGGGRFPRGFEAWKALPGVGPYTAAALASIVDGEAVPVVDGNVKRVVARFLALRNPATSAALHRAAEDYGKQLMAGLPRRAAPGDLNQALMELGATVCTPRNPGCRRCPLRVECAAHETGREEAFPPPAPARPAVELRLAFLLGVSRAGILLQRRAEGWNPGLYEPPSLPDAPRTALQRAWKGPGRVGDEVGSLRHAITHHRIRARVFRLEGWRGRGAVDPAAVPLTGLAKKVLRIAAL